MSVPAFLWYFGAFAIALGTLIVVHEFGHFIVARLCGVKVLRFSIGFGRPLVSRRFGKDGTEWALAAFPLGGYVKFLDEREGPVAAEEAHRAFNRQHVARRVVIVAAGPLANLLLAVVIYWGIYLHGTQELRPVLGAPPAASLAAGAGVREGETVRAVDGRPVATWQELRWELVRRAVEREEVRLEVADAKGDIAVRSLDLRGLPASAVEGDILKDIGLMLFRPLVRPVIGRVQDGSPAAAAGLATGEEIVAIDGKPIAGWSELAAAIRGAPGRAMTFEVRGTGGRRTVVVTPAAAEEGGRPVGRIGIAAQEDPAAHENMFVTVRLGPFKALQRAFVQTWDTSAFSLKMIGRMVAGEVSWRNVSGPVTIADYAGQSARMGPSHYLKFLALISISLGVLNLLPIPILDGGHLMYYLVEIIKGGPLSERVMEIGQQIGLAILIMLMAFAFYNDIQRLVSG